MGHPKRPPPRVLGPPGTRNNPRPPQRSQHSSPTIGAQRRPQSAAAAPVESPQQGPDTAAAPAESPQQSPQQGSDTAAAPVESPQQSAPVSPVEPMPATVDNAPQPQPVSLADFNWAAPATVRTGSDLSRVEVRRRWQALLGAVVALLLAAAALAAAFWPEEPPPAAPRAEMKAPAALPLIGSYVETTILADGRLEVSQWVRSPKPITALRVSAPYSVEVDKQLEASDVEVVADGVLGAGVSTVTSSTPWTYYFPPATLVRLSYQLDGVVERSPSAPGRALVRPTALSVDHKFKRGPQRVQIDGVKVLSLSCDPMGSSLALPRPCGEPARSGWTVALRGSHRDDQVVAQVDLR